MYHDVLIRDGNTIQLVSAEGNKLSDIGIDFDVGSDNELECTTNPLSALRHECNESLVINNENLLELVSREDRETKYIFFNEKCEVAFPKTYFKEKCGYTFPREHYSTPTKYFNQYLLNYSPKFVSKGGYIFFRNQYGYEKVSGPLIAGMFTNYEEKVEHFVSNYQGFLFMDQIKGLLHIQKSFKGKCWQWSNN